MQLGVQAQKNIDVTGTISDASGEPVIGATITETKTKTVAVSDINGRYSIQSPSNGNLTINYVGMVSVSQAVNGRYGNIRKHNR